MAIWDDITKKAAALSEKAYFCMTWIGNSEKRSLLAKSITDASLRIHELPDFHFYAIADGIKMLLSRCGRWSGFGKDDVDDKPLRKDYLRHVRQSACGYVDGES